METRPSTEPPTDPVAAVTHADPYAYYARLAASRPLYHDDRLGLWVATSAAAVTAILSSPACRVCPAGEPLPATFVGSRVAAIFRHRIRFNDGELHRPFKLAASAALDALDIVCVARVSARWADVLARDIGPAVEARRLEEFAFSLPLFVLGSLLGVADESVARVVQLVGEFVDGLAPGSTPEPAERAKAAARQLWDLFAAHLHEAPPISLLAELGVQARQFGCDDPDVVLANGIGFLLQAREATAGLLCAALLTLARRPEVRDVIGRTPELLNAVVEEVLRFDPPVQNTRRYVAEAVEIEGQTLRPGETVLVVLAAANRDPRANPDPDLFDPARRQRRTFTFGVGPHACPGQRLATTVASAGVVRLFENGIRPERLDRQPTYRPFPNLRIPILAWKERTNR